MQSNFGLSCSCCSENFERDSVRRVGMSDYATDFGACMHCHVMFFLAHPAPADPSVERDAEIAAKLYRKVGRQGRG